MWSKLRTMHMLNLHNEHSINLIHNFELLQLTCKKHYEHKNTNQIIKFNSKAKKGLETERIETLPAEEPTSKILSTSNSWTSHRQTAITSLTSAKPVRVALPVDFPAPLVSKVTDHKPLEANSEAMTLSNAWQPPMSENGCTNTITRFLSSSSASLGLKILVWSFTPSSESMLHDSTVKFEDDIVRKD